MMFVIINNITRSLFSGGGGGGVGCSLSLWRQRRWLSLLSQQHHHQQIGSDDQQSIMQGPCLMLSSATKPQSRLFFDPLTQQQQGKQQQQEEGTANNINTMKMKLRLNREIHLPEISGQNCIGSSEGFLITFGNESYEYLHATDPLTGAHLPPFPSTAPLSLSPDFSIFSLYRSKAILSPSLDAIVLRYGIAGDLQFARLMGAGDSWSSDWYYIDSVPYVHDCIFHEGRLHCVDFNGTLSIVNLNDPYAPIIISPLGPLPQEWVSSSLKKCYVVESPDGDDLFLVYRQKYCRLDDEDDNDDDDDDVHYYVDDDGTTKKIFLCRFPKKKKNLDGLPEVRSKLFKVFKFDKKRNYKLDQVDRIGDFAIFVGPNRSLALSVHDFPALKPNCIYFTDEFRDGYYCNLEMIGDTGVFNMVDGSINFFQLTTDDDGLQKLNHLPPVWFIPPKLSASSKIASKDVQSVF